MRLLNRLTYSNVVSTICLFTVLGGTAWAGAAAITGKEVKNNSLTGSDIKDGSLLAADFKKGQLPAGAQGPAGAIGATGAAGAAGAAGANGANGANGENGRDGADAPNAVTRVVGNATISSLGSFDIVGFTFGGTNNSPPGGGAAQATTLTDVVVTKAVDGFSDNLLTYLRNGILSQTATVVVRDPESGQTLTYTLSDVRVAAIALNSDYESITLRFANITQAAG